ncbi:uncharacterized protein FOBCDRAFT_266613 [Fusarium oxysporum Fo47]|uniref:Uncharacterized protein n=1 Tax=Fusarium oxysporum Fo47 TaxID=660027 RepID=W9L640_FUSOX|nr:uncharacterized protein FOBCDRAFT_266613 [Fusarium oxysporum Fo47]EWZ52217.1 hypothetical protein FOZG_02012 [Fusarium oxysporum Fo47]WJG34408.1 hypothetical protein FOBCDRAFT_266613 [Fusarium oxysporum Fo47]
MELAFEDRHLDPSKRDFSDLDLYEIICSLCGFDITEADEDELVECKVANLPTYGITLTVTGEKAAEPGIVKCHGRRAHPIVLHHECVDYAESLASGSLRDLAGAAVTIRGSFNEPGEMCDPRRRWQGRPRRGFISVPVHGHTTLWAKHTHFEGIRYIQSFSYDSQGGDEEMLIKGNTEEPLNVFIRHNHLGANKAVITEGQERPEEEEVDEQWWTCHAQQTRPFHFKARFDGIKIRNLVVVKTPGTFLSFALASPCEIRWAMPPSLVKFSPKIPLPYGMCWTDVQSLDWNKPGTFGYSFLLLGESFLQCNFHGDGPPVPYHKYTTGEPNHVMCLHFPMNPNERVSELWVRQYPERKATLVIVTDHGRSLVLGTQQDGPGATYHVITKLPQDKPSSMFHSHANNLYWFHFDSVFTWEKPQTRHIQPAWKTAPDMTIDTHYSSAKLDGVREITPCIKRALFTWGEDEIIQGLLLTYDDGTRTCIGEVLYDDLGTPQKVTSDTLWMRYVEYKDAGLFDENIHCCDCGIEWYGFSRPLLQSFSSHREMDNLTDEQDSDEEQTSHEGDSSAENDSEDEAESDDEYDRFQSISHCP